MPEYEIYTEYLTGATYYVKAATEDEAVNKLGDIDPAYEGFIETTKLDIREVKEAPGANV